MKSNYGRWTMLRVVLTLIGYSVIGGLWWHQYHQPKHQKTTFNKEAVATYDSLNTEWFFNKLPVAKVYLSKPPCDNGCLGYTHKEDNGIYSIYIDPKMNPAGVERQLTLFHEMCHVETYGADMQHGPKWVGCMRRLAADGAFDYLW